MLAKIVQKPFTAASVHHCSRSSFSSSACAASNIYKTYKTSEDSKRQRRRVLNHFTQKDIQHAATEEIKRIPTYNLVKRWPITREQVSKSCYWLQRNIPVRLAHMITRFRILPFLVGCNEDIREVHELYIESFNRLQRSKKLDLKSKDSAETWQNLMEYTGLLEKLLMDHDKVLPLLVAGFTANDSDGFRDDKKAKDFMDFIISERVAIRLLCDHQVRVTRQLQEYESCDDVYSKLKKENPRVIGIFDRQFRPTECVREVFEAQEDVCRAMYGVSPELVVKYKNNTVTSLEESSFRKGGRSVMHSAMKEGPGSGIEPSFQYIPKPLEYVLKEIIKNSMRAQVKAILDPTTGQIRGDQVLKAISVLVVQNEHEFAIKISDRGGGINAKILNNVWDYGFSLSDEGGENDDYFSIAGGHYGDSKSMFGYGCGLPISRIYTERMGGSIELQTIESYGTDVYIKMPYLRNKSSSSNRQALYPTVPL